MPVQHTASGAGAPTSAPPSLSAHYLDTSTGDQYMAKGTTSVSDWVKVGGETPITAATWLVSLPDSNRIQEIAPFAVSSSVKYIAWGGQKVYAGSSVDQLNEIHFGNGIAGMAVGNGVALFIDATEAILSTSDGVSVSPVATPPAISGLMVTGFVFREAEQDFLLYAIDPQTMTSSTYISADGQTWADAASSLSVPAGTILQGMTFIPGAGLYYGILASTTGQEGWNGTSSDGLTWTAVAADPAAVFFNTVAYCPASGRYVGMGALDGMPYYSDDGMLTFNPMPEQVSGITVFLMGVQWVTDLGLFVAVSRMPTRWDGVLIVSRDGVQWEPVIVVRDINLGGSQSAPETIYWDAPRKVLALGASSGVAYFARVTA